MNGTLRKTLKLFTCLTMAYQSSQASVFLWTESSSSPVYDPTNSSDKAYYPCIRYDENQFSGHGESNYYKMWYADANGQYEAVTCSSNGINWNSPVQTTGIKAAGYHAKINYMPAGYSINGTSYFYKIWYWDSSVVNVPYTIDGIRTADSTDGINWANDTVITQNTNAPLVTAADGWHHGTYGPIAVLYNTNASNTGTNPFDYTFAMYFDGTTGGKESIGLGYSADGNTNWTLYGSDPVLDHGTNGNWDSDYVTAGTVIRGDDGVWNIWYSGSGPSGGAQQGIGHAGSTNGLNWTKSISNPIFSIYQGATWRDARCYTPSVVYNSSNFSGHGDAAAYKMWFTCQAASDGNRTIGYATGEAITGPRFINKYLLSSDDMVLVVNTRSNLLLTLQYSSNLLLTNWNTIVVDIPQANTWAYTNTGVATVTQRFYRALISD